MKNENKVLAIKEHIEAITDILGIVETESNKDTPERVAKMYCNELFKNRNDAHIEDLDAKMKTFPNEGTTTSVSVNDIEFNSVCEHHWLPFMGIVSVSYIPKDVIVGLSKIPRVVKYFSQRPQLQERLTKNIGEYLVGLLNPLELEVKVTATHDCVMCRGAESKCNTGTSFVFNGRVEEII